MEHLMYLPDAEYLQLTSWGIKDWSQMRYGFRRYR